MTTFRGHELVTEVTVELNGGPLGGEFRRLPRYQNWYDGTVVQVMSGGKALSQITAVYWRRTDYAGPEPIPFDHRRTLTALRRSRA
ncbi:MAG: hypothetical protein H7Z74_03915 [Anaerolineae bacterium]|nr:hypothetical protein [Gemmatimonadaceae bacterium]